MNFLFSYDSLTEVLTVWRYSDYKDGDFEGFDFNMCNTSGEIKQLMPDIDIPVNGSPRTTLEKYLSKKMLRQIRVFEFDGLLAIAEMQLQSK